MFPRFKLNVAHTILKAGLTLPAFLYPLILRLKIAHVIIALSRKRINKNRLVPYP